MRCKKCGKFVVGPKPFCGDYCAHAWLDSKDRWLYVDRMGMWCDLEDDDDNMNHASACMHYLDRAVELQLAAEENA